MDKTVAGRYQLVPAATMAPVVPVAVSVVVASWLWHAGTSGSRAPVLRVVRRRRRRNTGQGRATYVGAVIGGSNGKLGEDRRTTAMARGGNGQDGSGTNLAGHQGRRTATGSRRWDLDRGSGARTRVAGPEHRRTEVCWTN